VSRTTSTILPPPSDFPVPMPEVAPSEPDSGAWRALVEITRDTVRPGKLTALYDELDAELQAAGAR
jgi:hypothetical protein